MLRSIALALLIASSGVPLVSAQGAVDHLQQVLRVAPGSPLAEQALEILRQLQHSGSS